MNESILNCFAPEDWYARLRMQRTLEALEQEDKEDQEDES